MSTDLRPVFPEERLLMELMLGKKPNTYEESSVWASNGRYYIDGKSVLFPNKRYESADTEKLSADIKKFKDLLSYNSFNDDISRFTEINKSRLDYLIDEASTFVRETAAKYPRENVVISFSGGKDSTATEDVVTKALADPCLVHIFGNTTLEFPMTTDYAERFIPVKIAISLIHLIGYPSNCTASDLPILKTPLYHTAGGTPAIHGNHRSSIF